MDTKLTLNINKKTVEKAKKYANLNNRSLSDIVENYLNSIISEQIKSLYLMFGLIPILIEIL